MKPISLVCGLWLVFAFGCAQTEKQPVDLESVVIPAGGKIQKKLPDDSQFTQYREWVAEQSRTLPLPIERQMFRGYMLYIGTTRAKDATKLVDLIKESTEIRGRKLDGQWLGLFSGNVHLNSDKYTVGMATRSRLLPLIKKGEVEACEVLLIYYAAIEPVGRDRDEFTEEFQKVKSSSCMEKAAEKHADFLSRFRP